MADDILPLSSTFPDATEAEWLATVEKALKGRGLDAITRMTADGLKIRPLYREDDVPTAGDPLGTPGAAPYLRGPTAAPNPWLPWDIRQAFTHTSAAITNAEILRDLERGVSSIELVVDSTGRVLSAKEVAQVAANTPITGGSKRIDLIIGGSSKDGIAKQTTLKASE